MTKFLQNILSLNCAPTKYGKAPHKPVLLLAVIESFESGEISENWIPVTGNLLERFHDIWRLLVNTDNVPNFSLPFYHLKNEKGNFWKLITPHWRGFAIRANKKVVGKHIFKSTLILD